MLKNSEQVVENIEKINTFVDNFEYSGKRFRHMLDENVVKELRKCMDNALLMKKSKRAMKSNVIIIGGGAKRMMVKRG